MPGALADAPTLVRRAVAGAFALGERLGVSAWAQTHRVVRLSDAPGRWSFEPAPYLRAIMDAFGDDRVHTITIRKGSQTGGTEAIYNMLFWAIDQAPGLTLLIYPDADSAADQNAVRFLPEVRATPQVARHLSTRPHDTKARSIIFRTCALMWRGAHSEHKLESLPAPYVFVDELDRCPPETAKLAAQRRKTYTWGKLVLVGKPGLAGQGIDEAYMNGNRGRFLVPCPACGAAHERAFEHVRWAGRDERGNRADLTRDTDAPPDLVSATACHLCPACAFPIAAAFNRWQLARGAWVFEGMTAHGLGEPRTRGELRTVADADARWPGAVVTASGEPSRGWGHCSFHVPEWLSGMIANPYAPAARSYAEAGGRVSLKWLADHAGLAWTPESHVVDVAHLRAMARPVHAGGYPAGIVPPWCVLLIAAVDLQRDRAYVEVRAVGPHGSDRALVWAGEVPAPEHVGLAALDEVLYRRTWTMPDGRVVPLVARAIDSGDGERTAEVYAYCGSRARCVAVKGVGTGRHGRPPDYLHRWHRMDVGPDGRPLKTSAWLLRVNTHVWKSVVQRRLRLSGRDAGENIPGSAGDAPAELILAGAPASAAAPSISPLRDRPGTWTFCAGTPDEYFRQLASEECVRHEERGRVRWEWRLREGHPANHYFDCAVYAEALADALGIRNLAAPPAGAAPRDPPPAGPPSAHTRSASPRSDHSDAQAAAPSRRAALLAQYRERRRR